MFYLELFIDGLLDLKAVPPASQHSSFFRLLVFEDLVSLVSDSLFLLGCLCLLDLKRGFGLRRCRGRFWRWKKVMLASG